jgi:hypothetical protein
LYLDLCRESPRCGGGYCKPNYGLPRGYQCICEGGVVRNEPCPFSRSKIFFLIKLLLNFLSLQLVQLKTVEHQVFV